MTEYEAVPSQSTSPVDNAPKRIVAPIQPFQVVDSAVCNHIPSVVLDPDPIGALNEQFRVLSSTPAATFCLHSLDEFATPMRRRRMEPLTLTVLPGACQNLNATCDTSPPLTASNTVASDALQVSEFPPEDQAPRQSVHRSIFRLVAIVRRVSRCVRYNRACQFLLE